MLAYNQLDHDDVINGNIFRVILVLCAGIHRSPVNSPHRANDAELWCFLWSAPEQTNVQTIETPVIWDAIESIIGPGKNLQLSWIKLQVFTVKKMH